MIIARRLPVPTLGALSVCGVLLAACGSDSDDTRAEVPSGQMDGGSGADSATPLTPVCSADNPYCGDASVDMPPPSSCGGEPIDITPVGVNVMFSVDGSHLMRPHWDIVQSAVKSMIESNPTLGYGAHLYWADPTDFWTFWEKVNICGATQNRVLDVGPDQATAVLPWLGPKPPGPGGQWVSLRPVVDPLRYYLEHDTALADPKTTNYLVLISSGSDNCFGTAFAGGEDKKLTYEKLATELLKKNIRTLPIGFDAEFAQRTWDGKPRMTNFDALDRLAAFGGTGMKSALAADSAEQLEQAIKQVAQAVRSCRFKIPDVLDPSKNLNPFELTFAINNVAVERDRTHAEGWDFTNGETSEVEVYGKACEAIQADKPLEARRTCNTDKVCGNAASRVTVKARAVQYLMDRSLSMAACEKPENLGIACVTDGKLSWWGKATRSITKSLVSTINDEVEFGLQYFPSPGFPGGCAVAEEPEVAVNGSAEISIIGSMLANLPTGQTPLVKGLEQLANKPGRLTEPGVTSAVIVISDGGNACDGISGQEAADRLGVAAKSLHDRGVKVYAIRFGNKSSNATESADQDAQLRAIVTNGGTAIVDAAQPDLPPYLEAPDETQLNEVLAAVSEKLAACDFELGDVDQAADKDNTNLYINGEVIPFDNQQGKTGGWGWVDAERTAIELYGDSCKQFKANRATSLVVEFGCEAVPLF